MNDNPTIWLLSPLRLYTAVERERQRRGLSQAEVMRECGLARSVYTRLSQGRGPTAHTMARLMGWLGQPDIRAFCHEPTA